MTALRTLNILTLVCIGAGGDHPARPVKTGRTRAETPPHELAATNRYLPMPHHPRVVPPGWTHRIPFTTTVARRAGVTAAAVLVLALVQLATLPSLRAQGPGDLDPSFTTPYDDRQGYLSVSRFFPLPNGQTLLAGGFSDLGGLHSPGLVRLNDDGTLDPSFASGLPDNSRVSSLVILPDGRLLVNAGPLAPALRNTPERPFSSVARLNANGGIDPTFYSGWRGLDSAVTRQPDGRILLCGGELFLPDGRIFYGLVRLTADGAWDPSFVSPLGSNSEGGIATALVQTDGKIVIRGGFDSIDSVEVNGLARLNPDGSLDKGFHAQANPGPITLLPNDQALILTSPTQLVRLELDGSVDPGFFSGLKSGPFMNEFAVRDDGKILVVGNGSVVAGFGNSFATANGVVLLNPDGSLDPAFHPGLGGSAVQHVALQADRKALVSGSFLSWDGVNRSSMARIYTDPASTPPPSPSPSPTPAPPPLPTVTVKATSPEAHVGLDSTSLPGVFTLTRTGADTATSLTVSYQVTGSAIGGTDYTVLKGTKIFAAGSDAAHVKIYPLGDVAVGKKVRLTLEPGSGYQLGDAVSDKVKIRD